MAMVNDRDFPGRDHMTTFDAPADSAAAKYDPSDLPRVIQIRLDGWVWVDFVAARQAGLCNWRRRAAVMPDDRVLLPAYQFYPDELLPLTLAESFRRPVAHTRRDGRLYVEAELIEADRPHLADMLAAVVALCREAARRARAAAKA